MDSRVARHALGTLDLPVLARLHRAASMGDDEELRRWGRFLLAARETEELACGRPSYGIRTRSHFARPRCEDSGPEPAADTVQLRRNVCCRLRPLEHCRERSLAGLCMDVGGESDSRGGPARAAWAERRAAHAALLWCRCWRKLRRRRSLSTIKTSAPAHSCKDWPARGTKLSTRDCSSHRAQRGGRREMPCMPALFR